MDYNYLVPANSKKQGLIFGFLTKVDLIILLVGISVSFVLLLLLPVTEIWAIIVTLLPVGSCAFLVFPIPNYHNIRIVIQELYKFYTTRQKFIWKGWCVKDEFDDTKQVHK